MKIRFLQLIFLLSLVSCTANEKVENINKQHRGSIEIAELFYEYPIFKKGFNNYVPLELSKLKDDDILFSTLKNTEFSLLSLFI